MSTKSNKITLNNLWLSFRGPRVKKNLPNFGKLLELNNSSNYTTECKDDFVAMDLKG